MRPLPNRQDTFPKLRLCQQRRNLPSLPKVVKEERIIVDGTAEMKTTTILVHPDGRKEVSVRIEPRRSKVTPIQETTRAVQVDQEHPSRNYSDLIKEKKAMKKT